MFFSFPTKLFFLPNLLLHFGVVYISNLRDAQLCPAHYALTLSALFDFSAVHPFWSSSQSWLWVFTSHYFIFSFLICRVSMFSPCKLGMIFPCTAEFCLYFFFYFSVPFIDILISGWIYVAFNYFLSILIYIEVGTTVNFVVLFCSFLFPLLQVSNTLKCGLLIMLIIFTITNNL